MLQPLRRAVPNAIRRRYALKFGIVLLLLGLVVGAVGVGATMQIEDEVKDGARAEYAQTARQESTELTTWNARNEQLASDLADTLAVRRGDGDAIDALFANRTNRASVHRIDYVDLDSNEIVVSSRPMVNVSLGEVNVTDTTRVRSLASESTTGFYGAYRLRSVQAMTYVAGTPDGEHAILVTMDAETVSSLLQGATEDGVVTVVDDRKRIVFDSKSSVDTGNYLQPYSGGSVQQYLGSLSKPVGFSKAIVAGPPAGILQAESGYQLPDERYVAGYSPVEGTNWVVVVHEPTTTAFGFVKQIEQYGLLVTGGIVLLIGVVGVMLGRNTTRAVNDLRGKAKRMEDGELNVEFETGRVDQIGELYAGFASMRDALRDQIREAQEAREAAEAARANAEALNQHLERKADEYSDVMRACADGDLTARMTPESESEAMEAIATEFNEMVAEIEATTAEVKAFASEVATASEEVTASSEEVRSASQQVTESIQEISDGAERQNQSLQSVSGEMESLSTTTEEIAASSNEVADIAERTAETGREGREAAEAAISGMAELGEESESAVAAIEALEAEMSEIDELIEFIGDIAKETNMLALNANIEASRGGASGDGDGAGDEGFAVVAQEVKELASETKEAAEDIEARLERIQDQTEETATEVQQTADRVAVHTESVQDAASALDEIADYAVETNTGVQEISAATEQQAASTQEVVAMVDDAATISEETTAEAENVAAAAEEQTTALTEVSNSASSLSEQASRLSEALDRFDTDAGATDASLFDDATVEDAFGDLETGSGALDEDASANDAAGETDATEDDSASNATEDDSASNATDDDSASNATEDDSASNATEDDSATNATEDDGEHAEGDAFTFEN